jgi:hypothetical protein
VSIPGSVVSFGSALASADAAPGAPALLALESRQLDHPKTASPSGKRPASWRAIRKALLH